MPRVLLVEDHVKLCMSLERALRLRGYDVLACRTVAAVRHQIGTYLPDALVVDVSLPDGDAFDVIAAARRVGVNVPAVAISGKAKPIDAFRLAQMGLSAFLPKPVELEAVIEALDRALTTPPDAEPLVRRAVGLRPIHEVEISVRDAMVDEALERTRGNRQKAADLLSISRQLLQHILRKRS